MFRVRDEGGQGALKWTANLLCLHHKISGRRVLCFLDTCSNRPTSFAVATTVLKAGGSGLGISGADQSSSERRRTCRELSCIKKRELAKELSLIKF
jgi:hypothetical protein